MTRGVSTGRILARTLALLRLGWARAAVAFVAMAGFSVLIDTGTIASSDAPGLNFLASALTTVIGYWVSKSLLQDLAGRLLPGRFAAYFGLGLLSGLAILLGLVLLVLPGIVLFIRWSISNPVLLGGDRGVTEAMQKSWEATGPHFWSILLVFVALWGPTVVPAMIGYGLFDTGWGGTAGIVLADIAVNVGLIAGWHAAVAIYDLIGRPDALAETFA